MSEELTNEFEELLQETRLNGAHVNAGASSDAVELAIEQVAQKFRLPLPLDYARFLRQANGLHWEDTRIAHILDPASNDPQLHTFSAHDLFTLNDHYRRIGLPSHLLALGFDDLGLYAYHLQRDTYHLLHPSQFHSLRSYPDFASLFEEIIAGPIA